MTPIEIDSLDDARLDPYRNLPRNKSGNTDRFVVEGRLLVERLLASDFEVESLLVDTNHLSRLSETARPGVPVLVASAMMLDELVGFQFHRGVLACGRRKSLLAPDAFLADVHDRSLITLCDRVVDQENLGGIVRNSQAFGAAGIFLGPGCADPFSRRVLRVSMGCALQLPVVTWDDREACVQQLRQADFEVVVTMATDHAVPFDSFRPAHRSAVVLGNEGSGLCDTWLPLADRVVRIPMNNRVDSLNVASASAVLLHRFRTDVERSP